jgi:hypothetical protein
LIFSIGVQMRVALSWVVGFAIWIGLGLMLAAVGEAVGVPSSIGLHEPETLTHGSGRYSYDEEVSSFQTSYGYATMGLSFMGALWAGQAIYHRRWSANFSRNGWYSFVAWLSALSIFSMLSILLSLVFNFAHGSIAHYARIIIELGALGGVGWVCYRWYRNATVEARVGDGD